MGHDWGGGHVVRVAIERPDLLRSWCTDIAGVFNPEYVWHDFGQIWQSDQGEPVVEQMMTAPAEEWVGQMTALGMSEAVALSAAAARGPEMGRCILALYRSAAQPALGLLGRALPKAAARPGLVIAAEGDTFVGGRTWPANRPTAPRPSSWSCGKWGTGGCARIPPRARRFWR